MHQWPQPAVLSRADFSQILGSLVHRMLSPLPGQQVPNSRKIIK